MGKGNIHANLQSFWSCYRFGHGHHSVFNGPLATQLHRVLPILVHGDEGRGLKRSKQMIVTWQSPLGAVAKPAHRAACDCRAVLANHAGLPFFGAAEADPYAFNDATREILEEQTTNYQGSTFLSRWLIFTVGSWIYGKQPQVLENMISRVASDLRSLATEGILVGSERFFGACIGVKGDLDFHRQIYDLLRSYQHVGTKYTGKICHACMAGGNGPAFEDYSENPQWVATLFQARPWNTNQATPALATIPSFPAPEELIRLDVFHIIKMGIGRNIAGGVLVYLAKQGCFDFDGCSKNFPDRLLRGHANFSLWCAAERKHAALRSFTKEFVNMKNLASAPWTNSKGADTTLLLGWLAWLVSLTLRNPTPTMNLPLLRTMLLLLRATRNVMSMVHAHNLWLNRPCARRLYVEMLRVLRGYQLAGSMSLNLRYRAFIQKPKNHALHHVAWWIRCQLEAGAPYVVNPEMDSCEMDEDYIGRIARLSRRVDVRLQGSRVFSRLFLKVRAMRKKRLVAAKAKLPR